MDCFTCQTKMKCVDDVNDVTARIDILKCPLCGSTASVVFGMNGKFVEKVDWQRGKVIDRTT